MSIHILIADDHAVMRAGLRALLEAAPGIDVVGEAGSGDEAIHSASELLPDIVLLDIAMPGIDGIEATRRLKRSFPQMKVLVLTAYEDESMLREAVSAGASGFIIKRAAQEELIAAIQAVSRGDLYVHPAMTRFLFKDSAPTQPVKRGRLETLTTREIEVMRFIIRGYTNRQIAEALYISVRTVEGHRASIFGKLDLKNRVELIEFAEKNGLAV